MNEGPPKKRLSHWQYARKCPQFGRMIDRFVTETFGSMPAREWFGADEIEGLGLPISAEAENIKSNKRLILTILRRARVLKV